MAFAFMLVPILAFLGLPIWGAIDAALKPDSAWRAAEQNKIAWVLLQALLIPLMLGFIVTIVYLAAIRPKVQRARQTA